MNIFHKLCLPGLLAVVAVCSSAQQKNTVIQNQPIKATPANSGSEMYKEYCAVCHGKDGKGDGPAAAALKVPPADLTTLAKQNNGKYPNLRVTSILRGQTQLAAHGSQEMPVWGPLFHALDTSQSNSIVEMRITNLNSYLESLQVK